jgi:hypothetical protein
MAKLLKKRACDVSVRVKILFSGCGTSGRIAFLTARRYNRLLRDVLRGGGGEGEGGVFGYLIAGDDAAILLSDELPEDDPHHGV